MPPRAVLMIRAVGFIFAISSAPISFFVPSRQRRVHRDEVGLAPAARPSRRGRRPARAARSSGTNGSKRDHAHLEAPRPPRDFRADLPEPDDAQRLVAHLEAQELAALPLARLRARRCASGMCRASDSISAIACSAAEIVLPCRRVDHDDAVLGRRRRRRCCRRRRRRGRRPAGASPPSRTSARDLRLAADDERVVAADDLPSARPASGPSLRRPRRRRCLRIATPSSAMGSEIRMRVSAGL